MSEIKNAVRRLCILGATGSIGLSTLDVVRRHPEKFTVVSLSAHSSVDVLLTQCIEFLPETVVMVSKTHAEQLEELLLEKDLGYINVLSGAKALEDYFTR